MPNATGQSTHHATAPEDRIPVFHKFIYGLGSMANDSQAAWIGQMVAILILGLGLNPAIVGLIGFVPRVFDGVLDPVVGFSSDNTRTKYGRRKPFIFWGAIIAGICYFLMFQLYPENSKTFNGWYFLILQIIFFGAFTCFSIPWLALGYEMTPDYHERTALQGWSRIMAQIPWLLAPWCWAILYNKNWFSNPETGQADPVLGARVVSIFIGLIIIIGGILPAIFNKERFGNLPKPEKITGNYLKNVTSHNTKFLSKLYVASSILAFFFSFYISKTDFPWFSLPIRITTVFLGGALFSGIFLLLYANPVLKKLFDNIVLTFKIKLFVKICAGTFLIFNGFMLSSTFILWVIFFHVFKNAPDTGLAYAAGGKLLGVYGTFSAICMTIVIPRIVWLSKRLGKKKAFFVAIPLSIIGFAMKWPAYLQVHPANSELWQMLNGTGFINFVQVCWFIAKSHFLLLLCAPFIAFGLGSIFTIFLSMLADICDVDELETGERREGMFTAVYWWMVKMGLALAGLLGGAMLAWTGFDQGKGIGQSLDTLFWMRVFDVSIPIIASIIAIIFIFSIKFTENDTHRVRKELEERRGKA
ncbi:MAG: MFS transporter [Candidatus Omnitrophica bacterium]|nr:MFS transporter [Candidatus Omnitrophota bacterium]